MTVTGRRRLPAIEHFRSLHRPHGPVHVWRPAHYTPLAGTTIFIHGWNLGKPERWYVDRAIEEFSLKRKFQKAGTRSLCLAIASREGADDQVRWSRFAELCAWLTEQGVKLPEYAHVIGHSGAWDNISQWLRARGHPGSKAPVIEHVSLQDPLRAGQLS